MKSILFIISFLFGIGCFSQQQLPDSLNTANKRANILTKRMVSELNLTDYQLPKVDSLNLVYAIKMDVKVIKTSKSNWSKYWKTQQIMNEKEVFLRRILNKEQLKKYKKMRSKAMNSILRNAF